MYPFDMKLQEKEDDFTLILNEENVQYKVSLIYSMYYVL
jgi:hypothetical protein